MPGKDVTTMNRVILMGRLTKNPEIKYAGKDNDMAVARYTLAVNRRYKRDGEQEADFISCVTFGKSAEFAQKYLHKGMRIVIGGRISTGSYKDSLGMMTINALVSSDSVLIPVQAAYLPVKGLQQLIKTISMVKKRLNRKLTIEGILLTMVDFRTNYAKDIAALVQETYGSQIAIFKNVIPMSVKAAETSAEGISIYTHCPKGKVSMAYMNLTQEVMNDEK